MVRILQLRKAQRLNKLSKKRRRGVSPVLATVIIFGLIITGVMVTFIQVVPYIEQAQSEQTISSITNSFKDLDETIKTLISESGNPGGFRTLLITKPAGTIDFDPDRYFISLYLEDQSESPVYTLIDFEEMGVLDWTYNSPRTVIPRGTMKYLTGPDQYKVRPQAFITGVFATEENLDITNLTLSHQADRKHHVILDYRISIYLTITTQPIPEIRIQVFLISMNTDFPPIHSQYKQITVSVNQNITIPYNIPIDQSVSSLDLILESTYSAGTSSNSLWSTSSITGLNQINYFDIVVQVLKYDVSLSS
ncbi:MAG: hypothetical protein ACXACP_01405 [Candidatus Hodarchaeales archaeon]